MNRGKILFIGLLSLLVLPQVTFAAWPGSCVAVFYTKSGPQGDSAHTYGLNAAVTVTDAGSVSTTWITMPGPYYTYSVYVEYFENGQWQNKAAYTGATMTGDNITTSFPKYQMSIHTQDAMLAVKPSCDPTCSDKKDQVNYNLAQHNLAETYSAQTVCFEGCQQSTTAVWEDCVNDACVTSVKYTYTGNKCTEEPGVSNVMPTPPTRCTDQINDIITQCGGSLNVQSFDFETCTGSCTPDSCQEEWAALMQRCGGLMAISTWDKTTCSGTCVSDPMPSPPDADEKPPEDIRQTEKVNTDGSKEVTKSNTYTNEQDHYTYKTDTTTYYDSSGNQTGQSTTTIRISGDGESSGEDGSSETFSPISPSGFGESYNPGEYDIPGRFTTFLDRVKSTGLFSFSSSFFNSLPGGGSPVYEINGGETFGTHTIDLSQTMATGLAVLKTILLACFGFLSIRAVIMKR